MGGYQLSRAAHQNWFIESRMMVLRNIATLIACTLHFPQAHYTLASSWVRAVQVLQFGQVNTFNIPS